ncbi:MAG TPA: hypothetical protein VIQ48_04275, partial [Rhodanobacter sp.]
GCRPAACNRDRRFAGPQRKVPAPDDIINRSITMRQSAATARPRSTQPTRLKPVGADLSRHPA